MVPTYYHIKKLPCVKQAKKNQTKTKEKKPKQNKTRTKTKQKHNFYGVEVPNRNQDAGILIKMSHFNDSYMETKTKFVKTAYLRRYFRNT